MVTISENCLHNTQIPAILSYVFILEMGALCFVWSTKLSISGGDNHPHLPSSHLDHSLGSVLYRDPFLVASHQLLLDPLLALPCLHAATRRRLVESPVSGPCGWMEGWGWLSLPVMGSFVQSTKARSLIHSNTYLYVVLMLFFFHYKVLLKLAYNLH